MQNSEDRKNNNKDSGHMLSYKDTYDELDNTKIKAEKKKKFSKASRYLIYILFTLINIIVNMDSGNIPPATTEITKDLNITDRELGGFASFVSTGTFLGGIVSLTIINSFSRKLILILANLLIVGCLFTFPIFFKLYILYINRVFVGVFMVCSIF
jgi:predicted MFS family arabinose efflux permease